MKGRVLVVDDDAALAEMLGIVLRGEGFEPTFVSDGDKALDAFRDTRPDLVLLDLMLPGMDGIDVCRQIRAESGVPIVMLTARTDTVDVVVGLESGADDYVVKPFSIEELLARVHAVLRRSAPETAREGVLTIADLELDENSHEVTRAGVEVHLTATEFELLRYLMRNERVVLSKAQILDRVWKYDFQGQSNIVELYIGYLRRKVDNVEPKLIHTIRGAGYVIKAPRV